MITAPALWFTSRSAAETGQRHCQMARFLEYHAGEHGTGWRRMSQSVPLATGTGLHDGAELIGGWLLEYQQKHANNPPAELPMEVLAWAATEAAAAYEAKARSKGFTELALVDGAANPQLENLILEQRTLVEAMVWVFGTLYLPDILARGRLLGCEVEESLILDCTCGLGEAVSIWQVHEERKCKGIVQQGRADWLVQWRDTGTIAEIEIKSKSGPNAPWEQAWEHSRQLLINMETASRRLGTPVSEACVPVFFKGWRGRDKGDPPEEPKYQHSPLCYGYFNPGSDLNPGGWAAEYRWVDEHGKGHTLPRTYTKRAVWDEEYPLPAVRDGASRVETWVRQYIQPTQHPGLMKVLGPYPHKHVMVPDALQAIEVEERYWQDTVTQLRTNNHYDPKNAAAVISRSWACTHFDGTPCAFKPVCDKEPGWEDPATMGIYEMRTPHHQPEKEAWTAAGVVFPEQDELDDIDY